MTKRDGNFKKPFVIIIIIIFSTFSLVTTYMGLNSFLIEKWDLSVFYQEIGLNRTRVTRR